MIVTHKITMDLARLTEIHHIDAVQDDKYSRDLEISLYSDGTAWEIPSGAKAVVHYIKSDGKGGEYDTMPDGTTAYSISGNVVTVKLAPQVLTAAGPVQMNVALVKSNQEINTFSILICVQSNVSAQAAESDDYYNGSGTYGEDGEDGGYYTPKVTQPSSNTMRMSFTASKSDMPAVPAVDITLPGGTGSGSSVNITTQITSASTNDQVPGAKAVYDLVESVMGAYINDIDALVGGDS